MLQAKKIIILLYCLIPAISLSQTNSPTLSVKRTIPNIEIKTLEGAIFNTADFSNNGKPIIINFWATNCKPCIKELSIIADLYDDWREETGVKIITISTDDSKTTANVLPFVSGRAWEYEVYTDANGDFKRAMNVGDIPHTFLLDGKGKIVWQHQTYLDGDEAKTFEVVKKVAKGQPIK